MDEVLREKARSVINRSIVLSSDKEAINPMDKQSPYLVNGVPSTLFYKNLLEQVGDAIKDIKEPEIEQIVSENEDPDYLNPTGFKELIELLIGQVIIDKASGAASEYRKIIK